MRVPLFRIISVLGSIALLAGCTGAPAPASSTNAAPASSGPVTAPAPVAALTPPEPLRNTIRWKTASEVENFGFDVYRAKAEEGPFERITSSPIPGAGTIDEPQSYAWTDEKIESGIAYWYYVESISMSGVREKFTPTFKARVKTAGPAASATPGVPTDPR